MSMPTPRLSVILAVYNQERFLPALLSSLERQDCPVPFEVLVCDDGSTVATADRLRACGGTLDLRHIWQPHREYGLCRSRNNGIRCAQGEVLVFVDGDCVLRPFFLRDHWAAHRSGGRCVCGAEQKIGLAPGQPLLDAESFLATVPDLQVESDRRDRLVWIGSQAPWMACTGGNVSVERARGLTFDERFTGWGSEDRDFACQAHKAGLQIVLLEREGLVHLHHESQAVPWNPTKGGNSQAVVDALWSKLLLSRKYPGGEMAQSLDLVRYCRYDARTDTWIAANTRSDVSPAVVLAQFEQWLASRDAH